MCVSNIIHILNILSPAIFRLPMLIPVIAHLFNLDDLFFLNLADPFVRFFFLPFTCDCSPCARFGTLIKLLLLSSIIMHILVALAHGGANPVPTPAGLKLGG